jgi:hypothetical protein
MSMNLNESQSRRCHVLGGVAVAYLVLAGALLWLWLGTSGVARTLPVTLVCFAPALLGVVLARTSTDDQNQYIARVLACAAFMPVLLLFWGTSLDPDSEMPGRSVWPFAVAAAVGHALAFVGLIFWGGSFATRVAAQPGASTSSADDLRARLLGLAQTAVPFDISSDADGALSASFRFPKGEHRSHQLLLKFDAARHRVHVREKLGASAARPQTADEASMRGAGDAYFDPARPNASHVSGITLQTSMIDPKLLAALPLRLFGPTVELPEQTAAALDADGMVRLLCAVVTRSGWHWQPVFFGSGAS